VVVKNSKLKNQLPPPPPSLNQQINTEVNNIVKKIIFNGIIPTEIELNEKQKTEFITKYQNLYNHIYNYIISKVKDNDIKVRLINNRDAVHNQIGSKWTSKTISEGHLTLSMNNTSGVSPIPQLLVSDEILDNILNKLKELNNNDKLDTIKATIDNLESFNTFVNLPVLSTPTQPSPPIKPSTSIKSSPPSPPIKPSTSIKSSPPSPPIKPSTSIKSSPPSPPSPPIKPYNFVAHRIRNMPTPVPAQPVPAQPVPAQPVPVQPVPVQPVPVQPVQPVQLVQPAPVSAQELVQPASVSAPQTKRWAPVNTASPVKTTNGLSSNGVKSLLT
jgi:hypothetical protein